MKKLFESITDDNRFNYFFCDYKLWAVVCLNNDRVFTRVVRSDALGRYIVFKNEKYYLVERGKA